MVPEVGFEPTWAVAQRILSAPCLPDSTTPAGMVTVFAPFCPVLGAPPGTGCAP